MKVLHVDDLQRAIGEHLGHSAWHLITQEQIDTFAEATGDHQWIHVDPVRAVGGPFGATVAHGYLTLSLVPTLVEEIVRIEGFSAVVNYGAERLRFPSPVPVDSRVRASLDLVSLVEKSSNVQLTMRVTVEREGSERPACVVDTLTLLVP